MKKIQALLINPYQRTSEIVSFDPTLDQFYHLLDCRCISVFRDYSGADFVYDDEYLLGDHETAWCILRGWEIPMVGKLLVIGAPDDDGNSTDIRPEQVQDIFDRLHWVNILKG